MYSDYLGDHLVTRPSLLADPELGSVDGSKRDFHTLVSDVTPRTRLEFARELKTLTSIIEVNTSSELFIDLGIKIYAVSTVPLTNTSAQTHI